MGEAFSIASDLLWNQLQIEAFCMGWPSTSISKNHWKCCILDKMGYVHQKCCEMLRLDIWWFEFFGTCLLPYLLNRESYFTINRIKRINYESLFHSSSSLWSNKTVWLSESVFCELSDILNLRISSWCLNRFSGTIEND